MANPRLRLRSDRGLTLTELVVYVALLGIVMVVLIGVFTSITSAQKTVTAVVGASNQGQAAGNQLFNAVSNASAVKLSVPRSGDQLLITRTADRGSTVTWSCQAWYYQSAANASDGVGNIRYTTSSTRIPTPSVSTLATWANIATGVSPVSGSKIFTTPVVTSSAATVGFAFYATGTGQKPQLISTSVTTPLGNTGSSPCF